MAFIGDPIETARSLTLQPEKPIHVRVAEALGQYIEWYEFGEIKCWRGAHDGVGGSTPIPRYDLDWAATGPLLERFGITVSCSHFEDGQPKGHAAGLHANALGRFPGPIATGATPLLAICNLILALAKAGKL